MKSKNAAKKIQHTKAAIDDAVMRTMKERRHTESQIATAINDAGNFSGREKVIF